MINLRKSVGLLLVLLLLYSPLSAASYIKLTEQEVVEIQTALEDSKMALKTQNDTIEMLQKESTELKKSYQKLQRNKTLGEVKVGAICFGVGAVAGFAVGSYLWLRSN